MICHSAARIHRAKNLLLQDTSTDSSSEIRFLPLATLIVGMKKWFIQSRARTISASAFDSNGDSFNDPARHNLIPSFSTNSLNPISMSYKIST